MKKNDGASQHAYGHICLHAWLGYFTLTQDNCHTSSLTSSSSTSQCSSSSSAALPSQRILHHTFFLIATILRGTPWPPRGHRGPIFQRCRKLKMKVRNRHHQATMREKLRAHLFALTIASLKAGCQAESSFRNLRHLYHACFTALKAPMAIRGATKSVSTLTLFQLEWTTMHHTATSTLPTCWTILFFPTKAQ